MYFVTSIISNGEHLHSVVIFTQFM